MGLKQPRSGGVNTDQTVLFGMSASAGRPGGRCARPKAAPGETSSGDAGEILLVCSSKPRRDGTRSAIEALIWSREQSFGIVVKVGETVDDLGSNPQPPGVVATQQPGMERGAGEQLVVLRLAQRKR